MSKKKDKKKGKKLHTVKVNMHSYAPMPGRADKHGRDFNKEAENEAKTKYHMELYVAGVIKEQMPKCYISGAIAHHDPKERMDTFDRAAAVLEKAGYNPVNPFKNGVPQSEHWTKHMRRDIGLLVQCDFIYMLKGWELSKGAKLELDVASSCGIKVLFEY